MANGAPDRADRGAVVDILACWRVILDVVGAKCVEVASVRRVRLYMDRRREFTAAIALQSKGKVGSLWHVACALYRKQQ